MSVNNPTIVSPLELQLAEQGQIEFNQAVQDFMLLDKAEQGRDYIVSVLESSVHDFVSLANSLPDTITFDWLYNWTINHVVRRGGKYNHLLPVGESLGMKNSRLELKAKSKSELARLALLAEIEKVLPDLKDQGSLAGMPENSEQACKEKLLACQKQSIVEQEKAAFEAKVIVAKKAVHKSLKGLDADHLLQTKYGKEWEPKLLAETDVAEIEVKAAIDAQTVAQKLIDESLTSDDLPKTGNGQPELDRTDVSKVSIQASYSKESAERAAKILKAIVKNGDLSSGDALALIDLLQKTYCQAVFQAA